MVEDLYTGWACDPDKLAAERQGTMALGGQIVLARDRQEKEASRLEVQVGGRLQNRKEHRVSKQMDGLYAAGGDLFEDDGHHVLDPTDDAQDNLQHTPLSLDVAHPQTDGHTIHGFDRYLVYLDMADCQVDLDMADCRVDLDMAPKNKPGFTHGELFVGEGSFQETF